MPCAEIEVMSIKLKAIQTADKLITIATHSEGNSMNKRSLSFLLLTLVISFDGALARDTPLCHTGKRDEAGCCQNLISGKFECRSFPAKSSSVTPESCLSNCSKKFNLGTVSLIHV